MVKLNQQMKDFLGQGRLAYVGTCSKDGIPNVAAPKGSIGVLDDEHLVFADLYSQKTKRNLGENPQVAVAVVNPAAYEGYQFKGTAKKMEADDALERVLEIVDSIRMDRSKGKYAVVIKIEEIFDLALGPESGKQIA